MNQLKSIYKAVENPPGVMRCVKGAVITRRTTLLKRYAKKVEVKS